MEAAAQVQGPTLPTEQVVLQRIADIPYEHRKSPDALLRWLTGQAQLGKREFCIEEPWLDTYRVFFKETLRGIVGIRKAGRGAGVSESFRTGALAVYASRGRVCSTCGCAKRHHLSKDQDGKVLVGPCDQERCDSGCRMFVPVDPAKQGKRRPR